MTVIEIHGLRKEYRRLRRGTTIAVSSLDLEVPEGGVFGFLGPNGAGKTTTIRCLLGLEKPTKGSLRLLGADVSRRWKMSLQDKVTSTPRHKPFPVAPVRFVLRFVLRPPFLAPVPSFAAVVAAALPS